MSLAVEVALSIEQCQAHHHESMCFKDVSVEVKHAKDKRPHKLLDNVSGAQYAGQMTALMGPSGSGKTTLLDVLSGRKSSGRIKGTILYDGQAPTPALLRSTTGYVEQDVNLFPVFTAREMLMYTAELRLRWRQPRSIKVSIVNLLLDQLRLSECADVVIGDKMTKGLSGGQAERVSIGIAMVCIPSVLYLVEPTSGLDSESAMEIMTLVRGTTRDGTAVAVAIHAPSVPERDRFREAAAPWLDTETSLFAELLLKAAATATARGNAEVLADTVRAGETTLAAEDSVVVKTASADSSLEPQHEPQLNSHHASEHESQHQPQHETQHKPQHEAQHGLQHQATLASALASPHKLQRGATLASALASPRPLTKIDTLRTSFHLAGPAALVSNPIFWQLYILMKYRALRDYIDPAWILRVMGDKIIVALIMVSRFHGQGSSEDIGYVLGMTASLFVLAMMPFFYAWPYSVFLIDERPLYMREVADGLYGPFTYITFIVLHCILWTTITSLTYLSLIFFVIKYQGSFLLFWLMYNTAVLTSVLLGVGVTAYCSNKDTANLIIVLYNLFANFSAGFLGVQYALPVYWAWLKRINFVAYTWSALTLNQYTDFDPVFTADGQTVLQWLDLSGSKWANLGIVAAFAAFFYLLGWAGLKWINHQKR